MKVGSDSFAVLTLCAVVAGCNCATVSVDVVASVAAMGGGKGGTRVVGSGW